MSDFEEEYKQKGVEFIAVNAFEPREQGLAFIEKTDLHYTWAFADADARAALGVKTVPTQIILDAEGNVAWTSDLSSVAKGAPAIKQALDEVLAKK